MLGQGSARFGRILFTSFKCIGVGLRGSSTSIPAETSKAHNSLSTVAHTRRNDNWFVSTSEVQPKKKRKKREFNFKARHSGSFRRHRLDPVSGWGEDMLQPPHSRKPAPAKKDRQRSTLARRSLKSEIAVKYPPHEDHHLKYSRRLEGVLESSDGFFLEDVAPLSRCRSIPMLLHGLDRVLFNPGVHWLQDPRSRVYNFSPYLENIPKVTDFAFERLARFVKSSRDDDLWELADRENRKFAGSTSSLSGILSHIYFLISEDKLVNTCRLSAAFHDELKSFTPGQRMPVSVSMTSKGNVYAIDSMGSDAADKNILIWIGTLLEKFLTMTPSDFSSFTRSDASPSEKENPDREPYRYAKSQHFVMRSQLDCHDPRLPGTGVFDLKTRACLPIRLDILNFEENSGYLVKHQTGLIESFEREYYDLIRSAFLKYSFQVRIGNMDGVMVAYHNTARMFGFQYIPLEEMDEALFGCSSKVGDRVFQMCIKAMECIIPEVTACFPEQSIKCTFEKEEWGHTLNIWVEPLKWEGAEEDRPVRQLQVEVSSFLGNKAVSGSRAVEEVGSKWVLSYSISRLSKKDADVRSALRSAQKRQFREYLIPSGVSEDSMAEWWERLKFGDGHEEASSPFDLRNFRHPSAAIRKLRNVSRSGREESDRLAAEEFGKPTYVLGETEPIPADIIQAPTLDADFPTRVSSNISPEIVETMGVDVGDRPDTFSMNPQVAERPDPSPVTAAND